MQYEVTSILNPKYDETGNESDYYGIYHVVLIVKTFDGSDDKARDNAYALARELNRKAQVPAEIEQDNLMLVEALSKLENAVNRSVSGITIGVSGWLPLITMARKALGNRVME